MGNVLSRDRDLCWGYHEALQGRRSADRGLAEEGWWWRAGAFWEAARCVTMIKRLMVL